MDRTIERRLQQYRTVLDEAAASLDSRPTILDPNDDDQVPLLPTGPFRRQSLLVGLTATALAVAAIGVIGWRVATDGSPSPATETPQTSPPATDPPTTSAPATTTTPLAPARRLAPFILIDGWRIAEAQVVDDWDGRSPETVRELLFTRADESLDVYWYAFDDHADKLLDRANGAFRVTEHDVLENQAQITRYTQRDSEFSALWRHGNVTMEVVSVGPSMRSRQEFVRVLDSIRVVDRQEFEAALPSPPKQDGGG